MPPDGSMIRYGFQDWSKILCTSNLVVPLDEVCNAAVLFDFTSPAQLDALATWQVFFDPGGVGKLNCWPGGVPVAYVLWHQ